MSALEHIAEEYLLNSLWQVPLLFATAWLLARVVRRIGPGTEHRVWVGALLAQCVLPVCAAPALLARCRQLLAGRNATEGTITTTLGIARPASGAAVDHALQIATLFLVAFTAVALIRLLWQCRQMHRLTRSATTLRLAPEDALFLRTCRKHLRVGPVDLASAPHVQTPITFGLRRPTLLLPPGFVDRVSATQLRAALSHELAHISRHDSAKHLLYRCVSLPLAYHPVLWLTLANLAETRERVCDSIAASQTGDARQYARALLALASQLTARRPAYSHAIGLFDANQLERRILMLNRRRFPVARSLRIALVAASAVVATFACTTAVALHIETPHINSDQPKPNGPARISSNVATQLLVSKVMPVYPADAKAAKIQGAVVLHAIISKTGAVEQLSTVSGPTELQASSIDAVRQWVYKPYLLNGEPVEVETTITVTYTLGQ